MQKGSHHSEETRKKMSEQHTIDIDWAQVDNYLIAGLNGAQCASCLGVTAQHLLRECKKVKGMVFTQYQQIKKEKGDGLIHIAQFDKAIKGKNTEMLKWLGKQRLGQTDRMIQQLEVSEEGVSVYIPSNGMKLNETK